jgi:retinal rod rhodopsin-sensitive cGMP 3',5'-cyclic phosphodiesterase subunit delta
VSTSTPDEIRAGFRINGMVMRDGETGAVLWVSKEEWNASNALSGSEQLTAHLPAKVLQCESVSREINFSSAKAINSLRLEQHVVLHGQIIETWAFDFGFVIPGSTNSWQSVVEAAGDGQMIPAEVLSGNLVVHTIFFEGEAKIAECKVKIFYD